MYCTEGDIWVKPTPSLINSTAWHFELTIIWTSSHQQHWTRARNLHYAVFSWWCWLQDTRSVAVHSPCHHWSRECWCCFHQKGWRFWLPKLQAEKDFPSPSRGFCPQGGMCSSSQRWRYFEGNLHDYKIIIFSNILSLQSTYKVPRWPQMSIFQWRSGC